jgi:hypothetical protein
MRHWVQLNLGDGPLPIKRSWSFRLMYQRERARAMLEFELSKIAPRKNRVLAMKRVMRLTDRRKTDFYRLIYMLSRCELRYISIEEMEKLDKWPEGAMGLHYIGGGVVGIVDNTQRTEMRLSQAAWEFRRVDSELRLLVALYGDLSGIW